MVLVNHSTYRLLYILFQKCHRISSTTTFIQLKNFGIFLGYKSSNCILFDTLRASCCSDYSYSYIKNRSRLKIDIMRKVNKRNLYPLMRALKKFRTLLHFAESEDYLLNYACFSICKSRVILWKFLTV